jgi:hypothetical protein
MSPKTFIKQVEGISMSLSDFQEWYPDITREQMARIAGCSMQTVNNWFATAQNAHRDPTDHHLLRLGLYHWILNAPESIRDVMAIAQEKK